LPRVFDQAPRSMKVIATSPGVPVKVQASPRSTTQLKGKHAPAGDW
jgi:hypothetical protein